MSTLIPKTPSTIASWALLAARAMESYGIDSEAVFDFAGLDLASAKNSSETRFSVRQMAIVWQQAVARTGDECFALTLTKYYQPSTYSAVGIAMASSRNLREGLDRCLRYFKFTSDVALLSLEQDQDIVSLVVDIPPENEPCAVEAIEAYAATAVCLFRLMLNDHYVPEAVQFKHDGSDNKKTKFAEFFGCNVEFSQQKTRLSFKTEDLDKPQMFANPSLAAQLDQWVSEHLAKYQNDQLTNQVQQYIFDHLLMDTVTAEQVASSLSMSLRTLQRKLKLEGVSFNQLLDECRHHMALKLLDENKLPLIEISYMLGFSDQSGFNRAFKRWTGKSPTNF